MVDHSSEGFGFRVWGLGFRVWVVIPSENMETRHTALPKIRVFLFYELWSKLLKGGLCRGLYRGLLYGSLRGILGVWTVAHLVLQSMFFERWVRDCIIGVGDHEVWVAQKSPLGPDESHDADELVMVLCISRA